MSALAEPLRTSVDLTAGDVARTLAEMQLNMSLPLLLHDAVALKHVRGDTDIREFKMVAREFAVGLNASVGGALEAMRQWTGKGAMPLTPAVRAFMADLAAIEAGTFGRAPA